MMVKILTDIQQIDKAQWSNFVKDHPNGNIFQSPEMFELYLHDTACEPIAIVAENEKNEIVGALVAAIKFERGMLKYFSSRTIVWGGPLALKNEASVTSTLLQTFNRISGSRALFSQFRNIWGMTNYKPIFQNNGYTFDEHLDIIIDLRKGKKILWDEMNSTRKKQIKRAVNRGITTRLTDKLTDVEMQSCYSILEKVYRKALLPFPSMEHFIKAQEILSPKKYFTAILAYHKNEIIGFRFVLCYNKLVYDWFAASDENHYDKYPNDLLPWNLWCWAIDNSYDTFDFGGAGKPNVPYGVRDYKLKFGGNLVNYGRFEIVHKPIKMFFAKIGFTVWQALKKI